MIEAYGGGGDSSSGAGAIIGQFANLAQYWARAAIDADIRGKQLQQNAQFAAYLPGANLSASIGAYMPLLLVAGAALLAYKALAK
jgi:hypothetical protein